MNPTHEIVSRCLALIPLIRRHQGISLDALAKMARLPKEQIADELGSVLMMCGVPPYFPHDYIAFVVDGEQVEIRFADHFKRPVSLTALEALALKLACESMAPPGTASPAVVSELLRKIEAAMSPEQRRQFSNLARRLHVRTTGDESSGLSGRLAMAVAERKAVDLDYVAAGRREGKERRVHPYGLVAREGHWYLVARDLDRGEVVPFRLDRVRRVQVREDRFEIAHDFRLEEFAKGALVPETDPRQRARIRARGVTARWLREVAAPGTLEEESDSVLWQPRILSEDSLARHLIELGGDLEILWPPSLEARVVRALEGALEAHG